MRGLNEGQAFYLSSVVFGDATWSEYAYGDWASLRDLSAGAELFDWGAVSSDPFTADHGLGIWLGRLFWQVQEQYAQNNQGRSMNYLLFKALGSLASPGLSNYTSHGSRNERLTGTLSLIATAIYKQCDLDTQQILPPGGGFCSCWAHRLLNRCHGKKGDLDVPMATHTHHST